MGKIKYISLSVLILCCFYPNTSSAQNGWGFIWNFGYSQFIPFNDFSRYMRGGAGMEVEMGIIYRKFEFCAFTSPHSVKAQKEFTSNNHPIAVNDKLEGGMAGFYVSYAVVYKDYLKASPLVGVGWSGFSKKDTPEKNLFTGTVGLQIKSTFVTSLGGLTGGLCVPLYLKYNYCFPRKYSNEINSGMHFISIGLGLYIKDDDKKVVF